MNAHPPGSDEQISQLVRALEAMEKDAPFELVHAAARVVEHNTYTATEAATLAGLPLNTLRSRLRTSTKLQTVRLDCHTRLYKTEPRRLRDERKSRSTSNNTDPAGAAKEGALRG